MFCNCQEEMSHGTIRLFNIPETLFWNYSPEFYWELFPNAMGLSHGNVPPTFREYIFSQWDYSSIQITYHYSIPFVKYYVVSSKKCLRVCMLLCHLPYKK